MNGHANGYLRSLTFRVTREMVEAFASCTGDRSSLHLDPDFGKASPFGANIVHGLLTFSFIAAAFHPPCTTRWWFRRLSSRFSRPVFADDVLTLYPATDENGSIPFLVRHSNGTEVCNGTVNLAETFVPAPNSGGGGEAQEMPCGKIQERNLRLSDIEKGNVAEFQFQISQSHVFTLHRILRDGLERDLDFDTWLRCCNPASLLAASMISPFVGMSLPGKRALLTNFEIGFDEAPELDCRHMFRGEVVFKSSAAASVMSSFSIIELESGARIAKGKIGCKILEPTTRVQATQSS